MLRIQFYLIITPIFILVLVPLIQGENNPNYSACSIPFQCGNIQNIGYPFWGDNRPKFCGVPDLKLTCDNNTITGVNVLQFGYSPVRVLDIKKYEMVVSLDKLFGTCYSHRINMNWLPTLPVVGPGYDSITLFYNCTTDYCLSRYSYISNCSNYEDRGSGTAFYFGSQSQLPNNISRSVDGKSCSCKNNVTFPIDKRGLRELNSRNQSLMSTLTKWSNVTISYRASVNFTECSECEESGGVCGSSEDFSSYQFICYCRDGSHSQQQSCSTRTHIPGWRRKFKILGSGSAALVLGMVILVALVNFAKKRLGTNKLSFLSSGRTAGDKNVEAFLKSYGSLVPKRYTYANIKKITNSFNDKLGEGGYGCVYKGRLQDGRLVAVKKLKALKGDGKDFINEVLSISRTNHVNVVTLLGFCFERNKRALVFEFLPNGSLEKFMHNQGSGGQTLQYDTMHKIALGIARGLDYLHRGCTIRILHFDIKPHNILLSEEFNPKITDFGLARLCSLKNSMISMSNARGTIGYIAPEVFCRNFGGVSHKSDVYSYGMMLLDLVCGRNNNNDNSASNDQCSSEIYFPDWIYNQLEPLTEADRVVVHGIINDEQKESETKMILVGLWCIQTYPSDRPPMNKVVEMLEGSLDALQLPPKPRLHSPARLLVDSSATE